MTKAALTAAHAHAAPQTNAATFRALPCFGGEILEVVEAQLCARLERQRTAAVAALGEFAAMDGEIGERARRAMLKAVEP